MTSIYSTRFVQAGFGQVGDFPIPSGRTAVIRSITAYNHSATVNSWWVRKDPDGIYLAGGVLSPHSDTAQADFSQIVEMRFVVQASEIIAAFAGNDAFVTVSGYLFSDA